MSDLEGRPYQHADLQQGYRVVGLDVNPPEDEGKDEVLHQHVGQYQLLQADLSKDAEVTRAIGTARQFFGDQVTLCLTIFEVVAATSAALFKIWLQLECAQNLTGAQQTLMLSAAMLAVQVNCVVNNAGLAIPYLDEDPTKRLESYRKFLSVNLVGMAAIYAMLTSAMLLWGLVSADVLSSRHQLSAL